MELDVSAPAVSWGARSVRTQIVESALRGRVVVHDCVVRIRQPDVELVVDPWFARVFGPNGKVDVTVQVCPGRSADAPRPSWLACPRVRAGAVIEEEVPCDAGPVNVQAGAMIDVLKVPQVGEPCLHPPPTPKFALLPL